MSDASVSWSRYAEAYDLLLTCNPAYLAIMDRFREVSATWQLTPGAAILDVGAGTGNYSVLAAQRFPENPVFHLDSDPGMNARAQSKAAGQGLNNLRVISASAEDADLSALPPIQAVLAVHSLYTLPKPDVVLRRLYAALQPGGHGFFCDLGRVMNVNDWARYVAISSVRRYGLLRTAKIFWEGREITRQNRLIAGRQLEGSYWLHSPQAFRAAVEAAGFRVVSAELAYRGYSDLLVVRKD